ncbi:hypothetical protein SLE2022_374260 [Rubroshorea leprosula]
MAFPSPQLQRFLATGINSGGNNAKTPQPKPLPHFRHSQNSLPMLRDCIRRAARARRWRTILVIRSDGLDGFSFAAVFDGHAGFSSVKFLRHELYRECVVALDRGSLLKGDDCGIIRIALKGAFENADSKLLNWLGTSEEEEEEESGSTATVVFIGRNNLLYVSHVLSGSGKAEALTESHRPYGSNKGSLQEIRRIREASGWLITFTCDDNRFGDMQFKTKKHEMLNKGVEEGRWSEKYISQYVIQFNKDFVIASPDVFKVTLGSDVEFLLLASDGLWDYMNGFGSEVVTFVRNQLRQHGDVQLTCEALGQAALEQRSQDNISIVIADLGQTNWKNLPIKQQNFVYELGQALATIGIVALGIWMSSLLSL